MCDASREHVPFLGRETEASQLAPKRGIPSVVFCPSHLSAAFLRLFPPSTDGEFYGFQSGGPPRSVYWAGSNLGSAGQPSPEEVRLEERLLRALPEAGIGEPREAAAHKESLSGEYLLAAVNLPLCRRWTALQAVIRIFHAS